MKFVDLLEQYHKTISIKTIHRTQMNIDVFKTPNSKEVREVMSLYLNSAKGLITPKNELYLFSADVIHSEVRDALNLSDTISITVNGGGKTVKVYFTTTDMYIPNKEKEDIIKKVQSVLPNMFRKYKIVT